MRPRMYGSTDMYVLRTSTSPGPGSGSSTSTSRKSVGFGWPWGRAASWISREGVDMARAYALGAPLLRAPVARALLEDQVAGGVQRGRDRAEHDRVGAELAEDDRRAQR